MVEAVARRVLGREALGELSVSLAWVFRAVVTVRRQFTMVPKTSVRRAFGGFLRMEGVDMVSGGGFSVECDADDVGGTGLGPCSDYLLTTSDRVTQEGKKVFALPDNSRIVSF